MIRTSAIAIALLLIVTPIFAADGPALFKANCAMCHGPDGTGDTPAGKMLKVKVLGSPEVQKLTDAEIAKTISDGRGKMRAFKDKLSADDVKALVAFVRTFAHK
jgi:mono/diheme cytochrome c family protein